MIGYIFKRAIDILKKKPFMLWGVSLLNSIIVLAVNITGSALPILTIPIVATLSAGMASLYLDGYNGKEVNSKQLFRGFSRECISRVPAGMLWHKLWSTIWAFVPVVGIIKSYSYAFTPYILLTQKDVSPLDALKLSMKQTYGYRGKMFLADLAMAGCLILTILIFALIMLIPIIGTLVGFVGIVAAIILYPLFSGLVRAGFYEEAISGRFVQPIYNYNNYNNDYNNSNNNGSDINNGSVPPQGPTVPPVSGNWFCTQCGASNEQTSNFCTKCGNPKK